MWWVSATEPGVLAAGMQALGRRLGVTDAALEHGDVADVIWLRLAARQDPWLLVVDNADDPQLLAGAGTDVAEGRGWLRPVPGRLGGFWSPAGTGARRAGDRGRGGTGWRPLTTDYAAAMLADHAGHHPGLGSEEDARRLAARLGGLPLALKIAGSYLAEAAAIPAAFAGPGVIRTYQEYQDAIQIGDLGRRFPMPGGELSPEQARRADRPDLGLDLGPARCPVLARGPPDAAAAGQLRRHTRPLSAAAPGHAGHVSALAGHHRVQAVARRSEP